jgi:hypothetical protein
MDCEGCEYPSILSTPNKVLSVVEKIVLEYHGNPKPIVVKLQAAGFGVKVQKAWASIKDLPIYQFRIGSYLFFLTFKLA